MSEGVKQESVADFKARIAIIMRERETGKRYSIIGAARPDPCVVRNKRVDKVNSCANMGCGRKG